MNPETQEHRGLETKQAERLQLPPVRPSGWGRARPRWEGPSALLRPPTQRLSFAETSLTGTPRDMVEPPIWAPGKRLTVITMKSHYQLLILDCKPGQALGPALRLHPRNPHSGSVRDVLSCFTDGKPRL